MRNWDQPSGLPCWVLAAALCALGVQVYAPCRWVWSQILCFKTWWQHTQTESWDVRSRWDSRDQ